MKFTEAKLEQAFIELLENEGYTVLNVSDGYSGNSQEPGWKKLNLPIDNS